MLTLDWNPSGLNFFLGCIMYMWCYKRVWIFFGYGFNSDKHASKEEAKKREIKNRKGFSEQQWKKSLLNERSKTRSWRMQNTSLRGCCEYKCFGCWCTFFLYQLILQRSFLLLRFFPFFLNFRVYVCGISSKSSYFLFMYEYILSFDGWI